MSLRYRSKMASTCQWIPFHFHSLKIRLANHPFAQNIDEWPSFLILTAAQMLLFSCCQCTIMTSYCVVLPVDLWPVTPTVTVSHCYNHLCWKRTAFFCLVWHLKYNVFLHDTYKVYVRVNWQFNSVWKTHFQVCICITQAFQVQYTSSTTN